MITIEIKEVADLRIKQMDAERDLGALIDIMYDVHADCAGGSIDTGTMAAVLGLAKKAHQESVDIRMELELLHRGMEGDVRFPCR